MDDGDDWLSGDMTEEVTPEVPPEAAPGEGAPADGEAPPAEGEAAPEEAKSSGAKKLIFQHWVRPKFLQYTYMYDYRRNYYDDVINYMDRRNKGVVDDPPRAQTWAERALRTYVSKSSNMNSSALHRSDKSLLRHISVGQKFHRYHIKSTIARKYSTLGFNTVSI